MIWYILGAILTFLILFAVFTLSLLDTNIKSNVMPVIDPLSGIIIFILITIAALAWPAFQLFVLCATLVEISKLNKQK